MHSLQPPLAHRDVKPHNVLLEARRTAVVDETEALAAQPLQARPARPWAYNLCHRLNALYTGPSILVASQLS